MLVSSSTLKDCECLSLSMSGCMLLLQASPADTRCTGLPAIAQLCLASEKRYFQPRSSEPWTVLRTFVQHELLRAECQLSLLGRKASSFKGSRALPPAHAPLGPSVVCWVLSSGPAVTAQCPVPQSAAFQPRFRQSLRTQLVFCHCSWCSKHCGQGGGVSENISEGHV